MESTGTIHFANYVDSPRLQRFLHFMLHGQPRTGLEIILGAKITAVSAAACELRRNGFEMECIKQNNPPIYQLNDPAEAWQRSKQLLEGRQPAR